MSDDFNIDTVKVRLTEEEAAGGKVFADRSILHSRANKKEWGDLGDVFITDEKPHVVAFTDGVRQAIRNHRLVVVEEKKKKIEPEEVSITKEAAALAEEAGVDVTKITPTGRDGTQITKGDVQGFIAKVKSSKE